MRGPRPYTLIAELTYRCPLRCPYCSNPTEPAPGDELSAGEWGRVFAEAEALGVMQVHLTGGEPLVRRDLEALVRAARGRDLYTSLVTSGLPLTRERARALAAAGLEHVQLSVQDVDEPRAARVAGRPAHEAKLRAAAWVKEAGLPLTLNAVLHRENIDRAAEFVALAERLGADRLELANAQYHGWALRNRAALLPSAAQLDAARRVAAEAKARLAGRLEIVFVTPDYHAGRPKACMGGWAQSFLHLTPTGVALPCHAANSIAGLRFPSVREAPLAAIWHDDPSFRRFRGHDWMPEPCRSCPGRHADFGGCRCQAFQLTGDASAADPACELAPAHHLVVAARAEASAPGPARRYLHRSLPRAAPPPTEEGVSKRLRRAAPD
ncbi:MAG TPA: pyrroloquinoline quinone biosynthesis protein PqqE [Polyangiaceae bacterium]|nr:pyrroloquinoline quinone biosynthesis protein PqqE [Polyangiaceae bacterium]